MHVKRAYFAGVHDGEPLHRIVQPGVLNKTAGLSPKAASVIDSLRPDPKYTFVLSNAMGNSKFFGSNSNTDWYGHNPHLDFDGLTYAWDGIGNDVEADRARGKDWPYGYPCFYGATVFAHHKNTDPSLGFGDVIFSGYNDAMHRVELVLRVDNAEAERKGHSAILDRIRRFERVDTSMGCFKAGAEISMADGTKKRIEDIAVGDRVRTHTGGVGRVTELHRRRYKGEFFEIKPANEDAFHATVEHPFFAAHEAKDSHRVWKKDRPSFDWHCAKDLDGAVLSRPKVSKKRKPAGLTKEWARLFGYYLAEGHVVFGKGGDYAGIELTVNKSDYVNEEIAELCSAIGSRNAPVWRQRENSTDAWAIGIYDPFVARECVKVCGRYSKTKRLEEEVLYWPHEMQLEFLGAYFNGDGFMADGDLLLSTSSDALVHQVREILFRLGIPTSYQYLTHRAGSGCSVVDTFEWVISIGKQWAGQLAPYCAKARKTEILRAHNVLKEYGDLWAIPIREYRSYVDEADVFNFEVEGDNSYIVNGIAAHNCRVPFDLCSVCTDWDEVKKAWKTFDPKKHAHPGIAILAYHRRVKPIRGLAVTKLDYCEDMQSRRGQVLPDGRKVFVYNDFPRFYDESFVWIGADRTARVMWFLQDGSAPAPAARPTGRPSLEALLEALRSKFASMDKEIPGSMVEASFRDGDSVPEILSPNIVASGSVGDIRETLSSLAALGIVATPGEFQDLVLDSKQASALRSLGHVFDDRVTGIDDTYAVSPDLVKDKLAYAYAPLMPERSSFAPFLSPRLQRPGGKVASRRAVPHPKFLTKLAQMYNGYRLSILEHAPALFRKGASQLSADQLLDADGSDLGGFLLGPGPMVQLISSHLQRSDAEGAKIAAMANTIAKTGSFEKVSHLGTSLRGIVGLDNGLSLVEALAALGAQAGKTG